MRWNLFTKKEEVTEEEVPEKMDKKGWMMLPENAKKMYLQVDFNKTFKLIQGVEHDFESGYAVDKSRVDEILIRMESLKQVLDYGDIASPVFKGTIRKMKIELDKKLNFIKNDLQKNFKLEDDKYIWQMEDE